MRNTASVDEDSKIVAATEEELDDAAEEQEDGETSGRKKLGSRKLQRLKDIVDIIFKVALIGAALFGWKEYSDRQHESKIRYALQIVDDWEDQNYSTDFANFSSVADLLLLSGKEAYPKDKQAASRSASNRLDDAMSGKQPFSQIIFPDGAATNDVPSYSIFQKSVGRLNYFYAKVGLCIRDEICEPGLMKDYFGSSSCYFYDMLNTHINRVRVENENSEFSEFTEYFCKRSRQISTIKTQ